MSASAPALVRNLTLPSQRTTPLLSVIDCPLEEPAIRPRLPSVLLTMRLVFLGALLGLTWSASLRGWMIQLAGADSRYTWIGTFVCLLLPGAVVGAVLAWSRHRPRRWHIFAPLLFPLGVLAVPGAIPHLLATGQGSASIGMVLLAMLAAYSLAAHSPVWLLIPSALLGFALIPIVLLSSLSSPKATWSGLLFSCLYLTLVLACTIPHRALTSHGPAHQAAARQEA